MNRICERPRFLDTLCKKNHNQNVKILFIMNLIQRKQDKSVTCHFIQCDDFKTFIPDIIFRNDVESDLFCNHCIRFCSLGISSII